ncbi:two-component system, chemotaxis family, response regulator CheB [Catalinimonas alkaloidigena]|uniref:Protein-glutamate methylesterase/protein-glutamine glutaminase n=2 Tax=Catalinimonas alkaloidigena TaxID=1075417 RepID=A0A1G9BSL9_9BACT|nr:two-component system, chemotaxis family, response regulator CheB [Catalinimonas alkaloidigena]
MRLLISDILRNDESIEVVDTACDGKEAAEKTTELKPDVLVLDMTMANYDGLYAVRQVMQQHPTPILILSALGNTNLSPIMEALSLGAYDYLTKPASRGLRTLQDELVHKVKQASRVNRQRLLRKQVQHTNQAPHVFQGQLPYEIIAIGASTGGPGAVEQVVTQLPSNLAIPVVIAQHMPKAFIPAFAERLDALTPLRVRVGEEGTPIRPGEITVAPGGCNSKLKASGRGRVVWTQAEETFREYNNPSVNALMLSVAQVYGEKAIGVILTGMGKDGTRGMEAIYRSGGYTIAQNEATSVVYGMPRVAVETGVVRQVIALPEIAGFLVSCLS